MKESFGKLKLLSLNVRGLGERVKRKSVFAYLKDQKCEVYYLQETYCQKQDEKFGAPNGVVEYFLHMELLILRVRVFCLNQIWI